MDALEEAKLSNPSAQAQPKHKAKALYEYARQTDEELSFDEDAPLDVYDTSDPDWTLVGSKGEYGFAPSNYIDISDEAAAPAAAAPPPAPAMPPRKTVGFAEPEPEPEYDEEPQQLPTPTSPTNNTTSAASALAGILAQRSSEAAAQRAPVSPPPNIRIPPRQPQYTPEESDEEPAPVPSLPQRPQSQALSPSIMSPRSPASPPQHSRQSVYAHEDVHQGPMSPTGYHLFNIHEMVSVMGKSKKMPMTLGVNLPKGVIMISPEKSRDGKTQEWTADKMTHYSIEGKHVFLELVKPSKSIDFHAGAKDTAQEIVSYLGELAGGARAEGLREVLAVGSGTSNVQRKGQMLYDFMAQGDDEVSVAIGDEVLILDDSKSDEWWQVRRLKNGKEGVVPSSYVEVTGSVSTPAPPSQTGINAGRSTVEQNRLEDERLTREMTKKGRDDNRHSNASEVGPGYQLPTRHSSLMQGHEVDSRRHEQRKRDSSSKSSSSKSSRHPFNRVYVKIGISYSRQTEPNAARIRTWTDRTASFKVEAEFIGLRDGKIHLHKQNGVKIAVPVPKMSVEDLEYVENLTGVSLDEDKPLSEIKRRSTQRTKDKNGTRAGISVQKKPEYDWFDFFLACGVNPQICERYAAAFVKDEMGEENLPDISEKLLRTLGLKEGDILRVMKHLDNKFDRTGDKKNVSFEDGENANGGLFSGPGGTLRNNTRKGRPAPPVSTSDVVDPKAFEQKSDESVKKPDGTPTPLASAPTPATKVEGFDDNAWEVKPSRAVSPPASTAASSAPVSAPAPAPAQPPTGSLAELSLLSPPLQPTPAPQPAPAAAPAPQAPAQPAQPTGATPSLFDQLAKAPPGQMPQTNQLQQSLAAPRQRPQVPQQMQSGLIAPPPPRAASAPQNFNQSAFGVPPLQPQLTGYQHPQPTGHIQTQISPPGQSLQDLQQQRLQQQYAQQQALQMQATGFPQQNQFGQFQNGLMPQPTGFMQPQPTGAFGQYPQATGFQPQGSPFADPPRMPFQPIISQPTGMPNTTFSPGGMQPQATGINSFLPPALQPQRTGVFANQMSTPSPPNVPTQQGGLAPAQPLVPQKTGPAPPVRFGVQNAKKLAPQPTGRRANLSQASKFSHLQSKKKAIVFFPQDHY